MRKIQREKEKKRKEADRARREAEAQKRAELTRRKLEGQEVVTGVFVGGRLAASNVDWILEAMCNHKLTRILNCTPNVRNYFESKENATVTSEESGEAADGDDLGTQELDELEQRLNEEQIREEKEREKQEESKKEAQKLEATKIAELMTQEPMLPSMAVDQDGEPIALVDEDGNEIETQAEDPFFATLETMDDEAKLAILESLAPTDDIEEQQNEAEAAEEARAERESAERIKEAENFIEKTKQRLNDAQAKAARQEAIQSIKLTYMRIPIDDDGRVDIEEWLEKAASFIAESTSRGEAVLVHCREGRSRSVTMALAYCIIELKMTLQDAMARAKEAIFDENINFGFKRQLMALDSRIHGCNSVDYTSTKTRSVKNANSNLDNASEGSGAVSRRPKRTRKSARQIEDECEFVDPANDDDEFAPETKVRATRQRSSLTKAAKAQGPKEIEKSISEVSVSIINDTSKTESVAMGESSEITSNLKGSDATRDGKGEKKVEAKKEEDESAHVDVDVVDDGPSMDVDEVRETKSTGQNTSAMDVVEESENFSKTEKSSQTPKPKPVPEPKKTSSTVKSVEKSTSKLAAAASPAKKKKAAPPPQKNTLFNYFAKKAEA